MNLNILAATISPIDGADFLAEIEKLREKIGQASDSSQIRACDEFERGIRSGTPSRKLLLDFARVYSAHLRQTSDRDFLLRMFPLATLMDVVFVCAAVANGRLQTQLPAGKGADCAQELFSLVTSTGNLSALAKRILTEEGRNSLEAIAAYCEALVLSDDTPNSFKQKAKNFAAIIEISKALG